MNYDSSVMVKLQALLKMNVANGCTVHEMETALSLAHKLALKHKIDLANLPVQDGIKFVPDEMVNSQYMAGYKTMPDSWKFICSLLQNHFNVKTVYLPGTTKIDIIGTRHDVDFAIYVFEYLRAEFKVLWAVEKMEQDLRESSRDSFMYGLYKGLDEKLSKVEEEAKEEQGYASYALVLVDDKARLGAKLLALYPRLGKVSGKMNLGDSDAIERGKEKGAGINIRKPLAK